MSAFDPADSFLLSLSRAFCSPLAVFIQIQGCVICLILAIGWAFAAYIRKREINRIKVGMKGGNSFAFLCHDINELEHSNQVNLPRVSIVMPLKGFGEHNLHNWKSQITSLYGGPMEFLFVVESMEDPAYHAVINLLADFKAFILNFFTVASLPGLTACSFEQDDVDAKVIVAGLSTTCSQKIHNQLVGVEKMHKDSKYVLFLDDDVRLHPGSIRVLTTEMEKNPEIFIQTGYPLDLPSGTLGSYCIYEYHMPCSMGFATGGKTFFLWGGCMMMHADDFRHDNYGVVSGLRDGGYSDDMTLAAIAGAHKRLITSPPVAVFPHPIASDLTFSRFVTVTIQLFYYIYIHADFDFSSRYWNYLRKQTFVLESYISKVNWLMNRALFSTHCYLSWGFVAPYVMAMVHVAAALQLYMKGYSYGETTCTTGGLLLASWLAICTFTELLSMWNLTRIEVQLCNMLSPEAPKLSLDYYNWSMIFVAMLVDNFLYPISALRSHFSQSINWSGIRYRLKNGKIDKIERNKEKGPKFTDLGGKHLYGKKVATPKSSLLGSLGRSFAHWHQPKKYDV
ncbi:hypothetical protein V6N12_071979 [Hibiscus sabdariffa]|uniref:ceramide glucosyltransferase n=1 Tax=Hibiscus sabdariffa TaxID=183260 RepID=A0ABR2FLF7_9ROSI